MYKYLEVLEENIQTARLVICYNYLKKNKTVKIIKILSENQNNAT